MNYREDENLEKMDDDKRSDLSSLHRRPCRYKHNVNDRPWKKEQLRLA